MPHSNLDSFEPQYDPDEEYGKLLHARRLESAGSPRENGGSPDSAGWGKEGPPAASTIHLTSEQVDEVLAACRAIDQGGLGLADVTRDRFSLPTLGHLLAQQRQSLHHGAGFVKLIGLDPTQLTERENAIIFVGVATHLSQEFAVQAGGSYLVHITDLTRSEFKDQRLPAPYVPTFLPPHTDCGADVVGMYVLRSPHIGGRGIFSTVEAVCNDISQVAPSALATLQKSDWPFDRPRGPLGFSYRPVLFSNNGSPEMYFSRGSLIRSPRNNRDPSIPTLSEEQSRALDSIHFAAMANSYIEPWLTGSMVFFNNRRVLHGRESFTDIRGADGMAENQRYILRLFMNDLDVAGPCPAPVQLLVDANNIGCSSLEEERWPKKPQPD